MTMRLPSGTVPCSLLHLHYICANMLPEDITQYVAFNGLDDYQSDQAACYFHGLAGPRLTLLGKDGMPAASGGYYEVFPGVWQSWMIGTVDGWKSSWRDLTKACRWLMAHMFEQCGARRLQTCVLASRTMTIRWYCKSLKMRPQGVWEGYGRNGESMAHFARLASDPAESED